MSETRRYRPGSGCYTCGRCGKQTRETGRGESGCLLCRICYDISGCENLLSDHGHPNPWGVFDGCVSEDEVIRRFHEESKNAPGLRGGAPPVGGPP